MSLNTDLKVSAASQHTPVLAPRRNGEIAIALPLDLVQVNGAHAEVANKKEVTENKLAGAQQNQAQVAAALLPGAPTALVAVAAATDPATLPPTKNFHHYWDKAAQCMESAVSGLGLQFLKLMGRNLLEAHQIKKAVRAEMDKMSDSRADFDVRPRALIPVLRKLGLNPVEFYTARACWQGVTSKRRSLLRSVIAQFPVLPADQKNCGAAMEAAAKQGNTFDPTDEYFVRYFFNNRKALKTLFRATLHGWQGGRIECYRGRYGNVKLADREPLECYSLNPEVSLQFGDHIKRHSVKLSDVWSVFTVLQNDNRDEYELTVYSAFGKRAGKLVPRDHYEAEQERFETNYRRTPFTRQLGL